MQLSQILIASQNPGKIGEIRQILVDAFPAITVYSATDFLETKDLDPAETGQTFAENAQLKARAFARALHHQMPTLADDSGIVVPALATDKQPFFPGVKSARWHSGSDQDRLQALLDLITQRQLTDRQAYYECAFCLYSPSQPTISKSNSKQTAQTFFFTGRCSGELAQKPRGANGFGYDPAFIPTGYDQTFGELNPETKNKISHRAQALDQLKSYLLSQNTSAN